MQVTTLEAESMDANLPEEVRLVAAAALADT
jgi:hypothetical protein